MANPRAVIILLLYIKTNYNIKNIEDENPIIDTGHDGL